MRLAAGLGVFGAESSESTIAHLTCEKLRRSKFTFPPSEEQIEISTALDDQFKGVDIALIQLSREIDLLREYRTRLIADVVTGKLDVRQAAAGLPEEAESLDTAEQNEDIGELDPDPDEESELR
jgi:type I restriction enzyme S subunit